MKDSNIVPSLVVDKKAALNIADLECSTRRGTFKTSAAFYVHREPVSPFSLVTPDTSLFYICTLCEVSQQ
jgi:hypothetical protein